MRKGLLIFIIIGFMESLSAGVNNLQMDQKPRDPWFGFDKLKHLSSSFVMTTTTYYLQTNILDMPEPKSTLNAGLLTISLGFGKEVTDVKKPNGFFSWRDLTADVAGAGLAVLFIGWVEP